MSETTEPIDYTDLARDLAAVLNRHGIDSQTGTPDFALAGFLVAALDGAHGLLTDRARWFGKPAPADELPQRLGLHEPVSS